MKKRFKYSWSQQRKMRRMRVGSAGDIFGYEGFSYGEGVAAFRRRKHLPVLALVTMSVVACIFYYAAYFPRVDWIRNPTARLSSLGFGLSSTSAPTARTSFSADDAEVKEAEMALSACPFPRLRPFDPTILEYISSPPTVNCADENHPLLFRTNFDNKLIRIKGLENSSCCYKTVTRGNASDTNIKFSKQCFPIKEEVTEIPASHEFIYVRCSNNNETSRSSINKSATKNTNAKSDRSKLNGTEQFNSSVKAHRIFYRDMFAFVPRKPHVEDRIQRYERFKEKFTISGATAQYTPHAEDKLNILILGLDAQSHMNFIRQMPLTYNYLVKDLSAIGMKGYTKINDNTFPNVIPLLTGLTVSELKKLCWHKSSAYFDGCPFIWKNYSDAGYHTLFGEDSVWMGTFNYEKKGFWLPPTDYYIHPLTYLMAKKIGHESWGNAKLCYGPRLGFEVLLEYIVKTSVRFQSTKQLYFEYIWANSLFHDYLNNPKIGDKLLYMTIEFLNRNKFLNNTALVILSDHGLRWGAIRNTYQGKLEERMPLVYFVLPPWFRQKYSRAVTNMRKNAFRLTTPFDVHETLKDFLHLAKLESTTKEFRGKLSRGISLFSPIPLNRTCPVAGIEEHWCVCNAMQIIPKNSSLVENAAKFIIQSINSLLRKYPECAKLTLLKVNEAMKKVHTDFVDPFAAESKTILKEATVSSTSSRSSSKSRRKNIYYANMKTDENKSRGGNGNSSHNKSSDSVSGDKNKTRRIHLQITLVANPSDAVFEATVSGSQVAGDEKEIEVGNGDNVSNNEYLRKWKLSGEISRINLYGSQSYCINDRFVERFCYCRQHPPSTTSQTLGLV